MQSSALRARAIVVSLLVPFTVSLPASAQEAEPAQVMVLGTWHFDNPGRDVVQVEVPDVLEPALQAELETVVGALSRFRPTVVVVEAPRSSGPRLDSLYRAYRAGAHRLSRNEVQQLGFRLAARAGLDGVVPADEPGEFPFGAVMEYAAANDRAMAAWIMETTAEITAETTRQHRELSLTEHLRANNDPADLRRGHGKYVRVASVGAGDGFAGAELLADWYERNIRIFSNIQRVAAPGERVLVIFGTGHAPILRELIDYDPALRLVEPNDWLPAR